MDHDPLWLKWNRLVDGLPDGGCVVVVPTHACGKHLMEGVKIRRGAEFARGVGYCQVYRMAEVDKLRGVPGPIILGFDFIRCAPEAVMQAVRRIADSRNVLDDLA